MASLPVIKQLQVESFPSQTSWIGNLIYPLNLLFSTVYTNLNNGITLNQNTLGTVKQSVSVTTSASGIATTSFTWPFPKTNPVGVSIISCTSGGTAAYAPLMSWSYSSGTISVSLQFLTMLTTAVPLATLTMVTPGTVTTAAAAGAPDVATAAGTGSTVVATAAGVGTYVLTFWASGG